MNSKRQRTEEEEKLNDSIQSIISEFKAEAAPSIGSLSAFLVNYLEKSEELRHLTYDIHFRTLQVEQKVEVLEEKQTKTDEALTENAEAIELVERDIQSHRKEIDHIAASTLANEASLHKLEQHKVDSDLFLSGFSSEPDVEKVTKKLLALHGLPEKCVAYKYAYQFTPTPSKPPISSTSTPEARKKVYHHMVVSFKDKEMKMKILAARRGNGPLKLEQLCDEPVQLDKGKPKTIRCSNRLSKFNLRAQGKLFSAKQEGKIYAFQLHNGTFRVKKEEQSRWESIDTTTALALLEDEKEDKQKKKTNREKSNK